MREVPSRLRIWWAASFSTAAVFILLALFAPVGLALLAAAIVFVLVMVGGYKKRRRAAA